MGWLEDVLFPPRCPGCGTSVKKHGQWCHSCFHAIWHPRLIPRSRTKVLQGCYAVTDYKGPMKKVIHHLKYEKRRSYEAACHYLLERFPWQEIITTADVAVPIPLSLEKLRTRGFNQAEVIFRPVIEKRIPWLSCLQRVRSTKAQWILTHDERKDNMDHAIEVTFGAGVRGKSILLVDDIYTSGSTMTIAAKALKKKGASTIIGIALASSR